MLLFSIPAELAALTAATGAEAEEETEASEELAGAAAVDSLDSRLDNMDGEGVGTALALLLKEEVQIHTYKYIHAPMLVWTVTLL